MKKIALTQGKFALVDDDMFEYLNQWKWYCNRNKIYPNKMYAARRKTIGYYKSKIILMHREILNYNGKKNVDHIDGFGLNNQRRNLRICEVAQNIRNQKLHKNNTSGYKGVIWFKPTQQWRAQIMVNRKCLSLGYFNNILDAARAYNKGAEKYFGEFARLNKI